MLGLAACSTPRGEHNTSKCLSDIDSISSHQTFREGIKVAEECAEYHSEDVAFNLNLAELNLLSHLVDQDQKGIEKASELFGFTLTIDSTFSSNHQEYNLTQSELIELFDVWQNLQTDKFKEEREQILIWALVEQFDSAKAPLLAK